MEQCVACDRLGAPVCSLACVRRARAELRSNLRELRRMAVDAAHSDRRQDLQERNGRLTSALIAWRPARPSNDACSANGSRHDRSN